MIVFGAIVILAASIVILRRVPWRKEVLIEGVFDCKTSEKDLFRGVLFTEYSFDNDCRNCFERNGGNQHLYAGPCRAQIPGRAEKTGGFEPRHGDSVKITASKNIFGRILSFAIAPTNFAEEFGLKQIRKDEEAWQAVYEAHDFRKAAERGMDLETWHRVEKEERIQEAAKAFGVSPMEAVAHGYTELSRHEISMELWAGEVSKKRGKKITREELAEEMKRSMTRVLSAEEQECQDFVVGLMQEGNYGEGQLTPEEQAHFDVCEECRARYDSFRENYLAGIGPPTPDCLTKNELTAFGKTGVLGTERRHHASECPRKLCRESFDEAEKMYLDRVAPLPLLPHHRMRILRKTIKQQTA
ncbi:MAG: hypothetical protein Q7S36_03050 [Candidatus Liptonbacteria bacterium]|nr:hypothetical protein [Candidatus Liptonbacteria bacterium]